MGSLVCFAAMSVLTLFAADDAPTAPNAAKSSPNPPSPTSTRNEAFSVREAEYSVTLTGTETVVFAGLVGFVALAGWVVTFATVWKKGDILNKLIESGAFLQNLTVVGVVIAVTSLGTMGVMKGELCAAVYSGIVGYVLGSLGKPFSSRRGQAGQEKNGDANPPDGQEGAGNPSSPAAGEGAQAEENMKKAT